MTLCLEELIQQHLQANDYPGASLALFHSGRWQEHYIGTIDGHAPTKPGLLYDLASVSKVVGVSTICIKMITQGLLKLDAPLVYYYPEFGNGDVTLRQLLTHTSGLDPYIPNRDKLNALQLRQAINQLQVTADCTFHYTDVNFLLLGFMLEHICGKPLDALFKEEVFLPLGMKETSFGPRRNAVPTVKGLRDGQVHDPKARVLGPHTGSAGLFSNLKDLEAFCDHYLKEPFSDALFQNYSQQPKTRSLGWNLEGSWIDHTGYTGPFLMINKAQQQAAIFLTNRTYYGDNRALWISKRDKLQVAIRECLRVKKQG